MMDKKTQELEKLLLTTYEFLEESNTKVLSSAPTLMKLNVLKAVEDEFNTPSAFNDSMSPNEIRENLLVRREVLTLQLKREEILILTRPDLEWKMIRTNKDLESVNNYLARMLGEGED